MRTICKSDVGRNRGDVRFNWMKIREMDFS